MYYKGRLNCGFYIDWMEYINPDSLFKWINFSAEIANYGAATS